MSLPPTARVAALLLALLPGSLGCAAARSPGAETQQLFELLQLRPGVLVADVGAGRGEWTERLAEQVGEGGHVFATEVAEDELERIRDRADRAGLSNVTTILGDEEDTGLPDECCDAILLRMVYHHFTEPAPMRRSLRGALRPGGLIAVIDIDPQDDWGALDGVPNRGGHGISREDLLEEMRSDGFELVARFEEWYEEDDQYCIVFRKLAEH